MGAGAIVDRLTGTCSLDAKAAASVFRAVEHDILGALRNSPSGTELGDRGFSIDVEFAARFNISNCVPILDRKRFCALKVPI